MDGEPSTGRNAVLGHYERGEAVNPDTGLPWPAITAPPL